MKVLLMINYIDIHKCKCFNETEEDAIDFNNNFEAMNFLGKYADFTITKISYEKEYVSRNCGICEFCVNQNICHKLFDRNLGKYEFVRKIYVNVYFTTDKFCDECKNFYTADTNEYWDGEVDALFHNEILSHGLATGFSGNVNCEELIDRLVDLQQNRNTWTICASHKSQCIGPVGIYVRGFNHYVSNVVLF